MNPTFQTPERNREPAVETQEDLKRSQGLFNRKRVAAHCGLSLRTIDELTSRGALPFFKIGKSIRYDLAEVETALRERFHVQAKNRQTKAQQ
jgi:excisionase family DNA binding protein